MMRMPLLQASRHRGFTLPELMIGMVICAMTMGALAALALAVGQAWDDSSDCTYQNAQAQPSRLAMATMAPRMRSLVRPARYFGWAGVRSDNSGSAVFVWMADYNGDGKMQLGEIALLEYNKAAKTLTKFQVPTTAGNANNNLTYDKIDGENDIAAFKNTANVIASAQIIQQNVLRFAPAVQNVTGATARPCLEYVMEVGSGPRKLCEYQTISLRCASTTPP